MEVVYCKFYKICQIGIVFQITCKFQILNKFASDTARYLVGKFIAIVKAFSKRHNFVSVACKRNNIVFVIVCEIKNEPSVYKSDAHNRCVLFDMQI